MQTTTNTRVAIYARVSTRDKGQDTENQLSQLRDYCARNAYTITREYIDQASGKKGAKRNEFAAMFTDASRRKFDVLLVWALDRFTRAGVADTFQDIEKLTRHRVQFISYTEEHFRTTGPAGELMIAVAAWIAKQERVRISERVTAGLCRARAQGRVGGRPRKIFDRDKVLSLHLSGNSMRDIARLMCIGKSTVERALVRSSTSTSDG